MRHTTPPQSDQMDRSFATPFLTLEKRINRPSPKVLARFLKRESDRRSTTNPMNHRHGCQTTARTSRTIAPPWVAGGSCLNRDTRTQRTGHQAFATSRIRRPKPRSICGICEPASRQRHRSPIRPAAFTWPSIVKATDSSVAAGTSNRGPGTPSQAGCSHDTRQSRHAVRPG